MKTIRVSVEFTVDDKVSAESIAVWLCDHLGELDDPIPYESCDTFDWYRGEL